MSEPTLRVQLLGDFHLAYKGTALTNFHSARLQALLAYLLLHRASPQPRQRIAFQLWPDSSETHARSSLRFLLHQLRRALPEAEYFIAIDERSVQWRSEGAFALDVAEFEDAVTRAGQEGPPAGVRSALMQAADVYHGELLPNCYDDWIAPERERLRQMFVESLERLTALLEGERDYATAIGWAQRLLRNDPLHEETYRRLMRLHAAGGDRVGVLRVFQTCVAVLQRELAAEPSALTHETYMRLLRREPWAASSTGSDAPRALWADPSASGTFIPDALPNNLPIRLTSFVGRQGEKAEVARRVASERLLTLTGAGGCGKTRLALEVAAGLLLARAFADGVWWVELAGLSEPGLVARAVASALGVREQPGRSLLETVHDHLRARRLLLLLDNCEHLVEACVQLAETLLRACPHLHILATSREPLGMAGESIWLVPPLSLETEASISSSLHLHPSEAVRLFVERASAVLPTFALTSQNAAAVTQVCRRLDGLPLAIELAAARARLLSPEQMDARLDDRFRLLVGGSRSVLPRHRTLRAALDWSYDLLSQPERTIFHRLAVFPGDFSLEAAETVCGSGERECFNLIAALVDKSLVGRSGAKGEPRFTMLEVVRAYALERLTESGALDTLRRGHADYFLRLAEIATTGIYGPAQLAWYDRLESEHDNLRAALHWMVESPHADTELALRLTTALTEFWHSREYRAEARRWLDAALERGKSTPPAARARALSALGYIVETPPVLEESVSLYRSLGDQEGMALALYRLGLILYLRHDMTEHAAAALDESLALYREQNDQAGIAAALFALARIAVARNDLASAGALFADSLERCRHIDDSKGAAISLLGLGELARIGGDYARAQALYGESLALARPLRLQWCICAALDNLGFVALHFGAWQTAAGLFQESLLLYAAKERKRGIAGCLAGLAGAAGAASRPELAVRLFGAADALLERIQDELEPIDRAEIDRYLAAAHTHLDAASYERAWYEGRALTTAQAVAAARKTLLDLFSSPTRS